MHVALDWPYRDCKVEQGSIVCCAAEGGPGFGKRVEAWRQRYLAEDHVEPIPFYLLALPLDLIAEHTALIFGRGSPCADPRRTGTATPEWQAHRKDCSVASTNGGSRDIARRRRGLPDKSAAAPHGLEQPDGLGRGPAVVSAIRPKQRGGLRRLTVAFGKSRHGATVVDKSARYRRYQIGSKATFWQY